MFGVGCGSSVLWLRPVVLWLCLPAGGSDLALHPSLVFHFFSTLVSAYLVALAVSFLLSALAIDNRT